MRCRPRRHCFESCMRGCVARWRSATSSAPSTVGRSRRISALSAASNADPETNGRVPLIVIDGKPFTWEQVGRMLMTFEGLTLDARVEDTIQVVGDPI